MKRVVSVALVLVLALACVVPVSATTASNDSWINVLDYATMNDSSSNYGNISASGSFVYDLGKTRLVYRIDMVMNLTGSVPSTIKVSYDSNSTQYSLNVVSIGSGLYRVYGSLSKSCRYLYFHFGNSSTTYTQVLSFKILSVSAEYFLGDAYFDFYNEYDTLEDTGTYGYISGTGDYASSVTAKYKLNVVLSDWKKFDYYDVVIRTKSANITSVTALLDSVILPCEVSYFCSDATSSYTVYSDIRLLPTNPDELIVSIRVDLQGLDRTKSTIPEIKILGSYEQWRGMYVYLDDPYGYVVGNTESPLFTYFRNLTTILSTWFSNLQSAVTSGLSSVVSAVNTLRTNMVSQFTSLKTHLTNEFSQLTSNLAIWFNSVYDRLDTLIGGNNEEVEEQSSTLESQSQQMEEYEGQQQTTIEGSMDMLEGSSNIATYAGALAFIGSFLTSAFGALGDYQVVYTLPLVIGFILFLASRVRGMDKPTKHNKVDGNVTSNTSSGQLDGISYTFDTGW